MINKIFENIIDFFYPPKCYNCKNLFKSHNRKYICDSCFIVLQDIGKKVTRCPWCSKELIEGELCSFCNGTNIYKNHSIFTFSGFLKDSIYDIKYSRNKRLCIDLALLYEPYLLENLEYFKTFDYVIAVPLHIKKLRKRGFNQSEYLGMEISKIINVPYIKLLNRTKNTKALSKYGLTDRKKILDNAFIINPYYINLDLKDKNILIIDDIFTTGSTIKECGKVLEDFYVKKIESLSILTTKSEIE